MVDVHHLTSQQKMADALLRSKTDSSLKDFLAEHRARGLGYEEIGQELFMVTDRAVSVSYQTVKNWLTDFGLLEVAS